MPRTKKSKSVTKTPRRNRMVGTASEMIIDGKVFVNGKWTPIATPKPKAPSTKKK